MPGIFVTAGMDLQVSDLKIGLGGSYSPSPNVKVRLDTWNHWLLIACENVGAANAHETQLLEAIARGDDDAKGQAIEAEFRAAMTGLSASVFAIDAFYATVKERFGAHPDQQAWAKNGTARSVQIAETLRHHFGVKDPAFLRQALKELMKFRSRAVHPHGGFVAPNYREDIDAGVDPRFITFSARHARQVLAVSVSLIPSL